MALSSLMAVSYTVLHYVARQKTNEARLDISRVYQVTLLSTDGNTTIADAVPSATLTSQLERLLSSELLL